MKNRFGTALNCIDGRTQIPVIEWLKDNYFLEYVDLITEPGIDRVLSQGEASQVEALRAKVEVSLKAHGSELVAIVGHHDCAGNPVSEEEHREQIRRAVEVIRSWRYPVQVLGLWINDQWSVEVVKVSLLY